MYKIATVCVSGVTAVSIDLKPIPRGITGAVVEFLYDDDIWAGLRKKVAFRGSEEVEKIYDSDTVVFPAEVAQQKNRQITVGVTGVSEDGTVVIPTLWAELGAVADSAYGDYPAPGEPMPPVWAQLLAMIGTLANLNTEARENLVAAINEVLSKAGTGGGNVDLTGYATEQFVREGFQPKGDYLTEHQDISGKLDADKLPEVVNNALAQAKASGEFDGEPGKDGADGYTPVKGKDYFDGKDGVDGQPGKDGADGVSPVVSVAAITGGHRVTITDKDGTKTVDVMDGSDGKPGADGSPGKDGSAGKDGVSATHSWNGTVLSITSASGTSSADLKGEKGNEGEKGDPGEKGEKGDPGAQGDPGKDGTSVAVKSVSESNAGGGSNVVTFTDGKTLTVKNGKDGAAGKTPVRGTDYWTGTDKASMIQDVISALGGSPVFGVVDSDNNIILTGNLAEGTYTLKYEDADGDVTVIGTLNHTNAPEPTYTNLFVPGTASLNTRMSGSSKTSKTENGYVMSALIPISATSVPASGAATENFIAVPASMWTKSANMFLAYDDTNVTNGYVDAGTTKGTVVGNWVKIPLVNQYAEAFICRGVTLSLYVKGSALTESDIQNIEIYFNEIPE